MNPSRGALLKPSQRNGSPKKSSTLQARSVSRYEILKDKIRTWWNDRLVIGEALREVRDGRLYKNEYPNFEDFCTDEFGLKHTQAYRLIEAVTVKESVLKVSPIGERIVNEGQARALSAVPVEARVEVLTKASENGSVTAKRITEAAKTVVQKIVGKPTAKPLSTDRFGRVIPDEILEEWNRATQTGNKLQTLAREIKSILSEGFSGPKQDRLKDVIYAEITNTAISDAQALGWYLSSVIPYALCPTCQGFNRKSCALCKKRGWISKFLYNSPAVSKETKAIIEGK